MKFGQSVNCCVSVEFHQFFEERAQGSVGGITVLEVHFDCRAIWRFAHPNIKIFAFSSFEKEYIIAIIQLGKFIQLIQLGFGVEFCIFAAVREKGIDIVEEMPVTREKHF